MKLRIELSREAEERLSHWAKQMHRKPDELATEAILELLEDLDDAAEAKRRLETGGERISLEQFIEEAGLTEAEIEAAKTD